MKKYLIFAMAALTSATAYATKTDGTWRVVEKSCAGKPAIISQDERIQFGEARSCVTSSWIVTAR